MGNTIRDLSGAKYIEMSNGRFARQPSASVFASGAWTKIRVALYMDLFQIGSDVGSTPVFQAGLCSGTTNIPGDATPTNAVGLNVTAASWSWYNGGGSSYIYNCGPCYPFKNVGGVLTNGTSSTPLLFATSAEANGLSAELYVDITKGSPNYTVQAFCPTTVSPTTTEATFEAQSIASSPVIAGGHAFLTAQTIAFNESAGTLDSVFVYHKPTTGYARIKQLRVVRLA